MNAERLHAICVTLKESIDSAALPKKLQQTVAAITNIANNPQNPAQQEALSNNLNDLYSILEDFPTNYFSPAWRQVLDEIGGSELLGSQLETRIRNIIERNQITPASARTELQELFEQLQLFEAAVDNVVDGLGQFGIGAEELGPGECEVGILIPRNAVHSNLQEFGQELQNLNFIFGTFSELASGDRDTFKIRTISSTDLSVFLDAIPVVAACVAHAASKVIDLYKNLLEVKKLRGELKSHGLEDEELQGITEHVNSFMSKELDELASEIVEQYYQGKNDGRKNELANAVQIALNKLANRVDQGFNIEVRCTPLEESAGADEESEDTQENWDNIQYVLSVSKTLQFIKPTGPRILHLPEKAEKSKSKKE